MKIHKDTLKEYLVDRLLLSDDSYEIDRIESLKMVKNSLNDDSLEIFVYFSINGSELYSETVNIHYETFINFLNKKRNKKIKKIKSIING